MHRLTKMNLKTACNKYVDESTIANLQKWIDLFNSFEPGEAEKTFENKNYTKYEVYMKIISNCPMGLEQEMSITTNYLQLKTIYHQRKTHKLQEDWGNFCQWIESLPLFKEIAL